MDISEVEFEPLSSGPDRTPVAAARSGRPSWLVVAAALLSVGALVVLVAQRETPPRLSGGSPTAAASPRGAVLAGVRPATAPPSVRLADGVAHDVCIPESVGTPDALEQRIEQCQRSLGRAASQSAEYARCFEHEAGTPDSLERRADVCRISAERGLIEELNTRRAVSAAALRDTDAYRACLPSGPGTADSLERWSAHCELRASTGFTAP